MGGINEREYVPLSLAERRPVHKQNLFSLPAISGILAMRHSASMLGGLCDYAMPSVDSGSPETVKC